MGVDVRKVRWVVKDGSIFTEEEFKVKLEFKFIMTQVSVAFNVGREVAEHLVRLHNDQLSLE
jgi:phosphotransferase system IIB component